MKSNGFTKKKSFLIATAVLSVVVLLIIASCAPSIGKPETEGDYIPDANAELPRMPEWFVWHPNAECSVSICHTSEAASKRDDTLLVSIHDVQAGNSECMDCHDTAALQAAHSTTGQATDQGFDYRGFCFDCHVSQAELAELTANSTVLTDAMGTVVNPHDLPQGLEHTVKDVAQCANCHKMHRTYNPIDYCYYTCHHSKVFECDTCHH
ncbi:MAG: hypothetical protein FWD45_04655 [Coriobacteriia bacterium]|nr:hypothetical protein [Coriobacteriia bacterium]